MKKPHCKHLDNVLKQSIKTNGGLHRMVYKLGSDRGFTLRTNHDLTLSG
ncbi:hypothetical protein MNBD_GAMMA04-1519 [hydrothermal vent metagenome]|uniref:Uncharacterized protein n=1 Tax=hydrothermal vent metagenome TaxID=652676 RepID=A0A3B0VVC7_9ZZZZ